jgi:hypothetical protein
VLTDNGLFAYPRYSIAFPQFQPTNEVPVKFRFRGAPSAKLTFGLVLPQLASTATLEEGVPSPWRNFTLRVTLEEEGTVLRHISGKLESWHYSQSVSRKMLWHEQLRDVAFKTSQTYTITIGVSGDDSRAKPLIFQPVLEGGGSERP